MDMLGMYPTFYVPAIGTAWVMGIIGVIHVVASHTSVGASFLFALLETKAYRENKPQLLDFIRTIAHPRPHPRYPERSVAEVFDEERPRLLSLPDPLPETDLVAPITVDKTAFVRFDTNRYSVPSTHARGTLTLVASDTELRLLAHICGGEPLRAIGC